MKSSGTQRRWAATAASRDAFILKTPAVPLLLQWMSAKTFWALSRRAVLGSLLAALALLLEGCDVPRVEGYFGTVSFNIKTHQVAYWRQKTSYWDVNAYKDPVTNEPQFNSCMNPSIDTLDVCSGRGTCVPFDRKDVLNPVFFCQCDQGWGDPECATKRKRQSTAWLLSLLFGPLGADEFYLGWAPEGFMKLLITLLGLQLFAIFGVNTSLGNIGVVVILVPWMGDLIRIGSTPVRASNYRVAADLPQWDFAIFTILYFATIGYCIGVASMYYVVLQRRYKITKALTYGSMEFV